MYKAVGQNQSLLVKKKSGEKFHQTNKVLKPDILLIQELKVTAPSGTYFEISCLK